MKISKKQRFHLVFDGVLLTKTPKKWKQTKKVLSKLHNRYAVEVGIIEVKPKTIKRFRQFESRESSP